VAPVEYLFRTEIQAKTAVHFRRIPKTRENRDELTNITRHEVVEECDFVMAVRYIMMQVGSLMAAGS
jgi:hypothetical protein